MRKKVLIADDTALMRELLKSALDPADYQIVGEAVTGEQAVEFYNYSTQNKENRQSIVLLLSKHHLYRITKYN